MSKEAKTAPQQSAEIPKGSFGAIRIRAVAAATAVKRKPKEAAPKRDLPPLLRKDQFYD
ncbi:hypothetical protein [Terrarubrum flagellatum]|uniref:hypothetical protein n=1 Tax=Terrirubrum flagellatum TaxID=2895980 RepID=UPI0031453406